MQSIPPSPPSSHSPVIPNPTIHIKAIQRADLPQEETCHVFSYRGILGQGGSRNNYIGPDGTPTSYKKTISATALQADAKSIQEGHYLGRTSLVTDPSPSLFSTFQPETRRALLQHRFIDLHRDLFKAKEIWTTLLICADTQSPLPPHFKFLKDENDNPYLDLTYQNNVNDNLIETPPPYQDGLAQLDHNNNGLSTHTCSALLKAFHAYCRSESIDDTVSEVMNEISSHNDRVPISRLFQYLDFQFSAIADDDYPGWPTSKFLIGSDDMSYNHSINGHKEFMKDWLVWVLTCLTTVTKNGHISISTPEEVLSKKHVLASQEQRLLEKHRPVERATIHIVSIEPATSHQIEETGPETPALSKKEITALLKETEKTTRDLESKRHQYNSKKHNITENDITAFLTIEIPEQIQSIRAILNDKTISLTNSQKQDLNKQIDALTLTQKFTQNKRDRDTARTHRSSFKSNVLAIVAANAIKKPRH